MAFTIEIILYMLLAVGATLYFLCRKRKNYPPGPPPWPIIGNIFEIGQEYHKSFRAMGKKYGPISSAKFGLKDTVTIHDVHLIREAFNENSFSGRPPSAIIDFLAGRNDGILQSEGKLWVEQRRFALRTLRDFGFGRKGMESLIMDEVNEFVNWIAKQGGKPISLHGRINLAVVNALLAVLTGERYDHEHPKLVKILEDLEAAGQACLANMGTYFLVAYYPKLAQRFPEKSGWNYISGLSKQREDLFDEIISEHRRTRSEDHARDFIDVYLGEVDKTVDPTSSFHHSTAGKSLQSIMSDFFLAGSDTTSSTLNWAILYLIHNPHIEAKLHEELDRVIGNSRVPSLTDRNSLPYTEAFIMEVLRYSSILPLGVAHMTMEDVHFHGFLIPKGTTVMSNIYAVHTDPNIWGDPEVFRPERFLSKDGLTLKKNENLIPFGVGKRTCLGFNLALDELFLFILTIVQRFNISAETGKPKPTLDPRFGQVTLVTHPYSVVMKERF